jgi:hypothetical protein
MRTFVKAAVFHVIQIVWSPIAVVVYVPFVIQLIAYSRKSGVSSTTGASLYTRWMQHHLGTRLDEPCVRLTTVLPNFSTSALRLLMNGTLLGHRITGYVPRKYRYPYPGEPPMSQQMAARTTYYDAALDRHLDSIDQLVVLGAGYDTRSYRMPDRIRCFEIDTPQTQQNKVEMLTRAGLDTSRTTFTSRIFTARSARRCCRGVDSVATARFLHA